MGCDKIIYNELLKKFTGKKKNSGQEFMEVAKNENTINGWKLEDERNGSERERIC